MLLPGCHGRARILPSVAGRRDPSSPRLREREKGSEAVCRPWPSYGRVRCRSMPTWRPAARWSSRGRVAPRAPAGWCSGRGIGGNVRACGRCRKIFVPRLRCGGCGARPAGHPRRHARGRKAPGSSLLSVPSSWLFPGRRPGSPLTEDALAQRLHALGISPRQGRSTALFTLAADVPAAILAKTLGIHVKAAIQWQKISGGDWSGYAADISRRGQAQEQTPARDQHADPLPSA